MSYFGYDTPEQKILEFVEDMKRYDGLSSRKACEVLCKVLSYFCGEGLIDRAVFEEAKVEAKREIAAEMLAAIEGRRQTP